MFRLCTRIHICTKRSNELHHMPCWNVCRRYGNGKTWCMLVCMHACMYDMYLYVDSSQTQSSICCDVCVHVCVYCIYICMYIVNLCVYSSKWHMIYYWYGAIFVLIHVFMISNETCLHMYVCMYICMFVSMYDKY